MNEMVQLLMRVLGAVNSVITLDEGTQSKRLPPGFYELRTVNGWTYFRRGDQTIVLDANDLPIASTNAIIITPEQPSYLHVEHSKEWSFLVETGATLQIIHRVAW